MIIAEIIGGLGNQMFQYAAARALSLRTGQALILDTSKFKGYSLHQGFELHRIFGCPVGIATSVDLYKVLGWQAPGPVRRMLLTRGFARLRKPVYVVEPHFQYWPGIDHVTENCFLTGYWQSEKYFLDAAPTIRAAFTFNQSMSAQNLNVAFAIQNSSSVSLHVRRGDYATHAGTTAVHGLCSLEYYKAGIQLVSQYLENPHLYIFSDDVDWVKNHLATDLPCLYIDHNHGKESFNDMHLMSLCRHHIVANSSFSWWGAWLNPSPDKIVVAPKNWFATGVDTKDLIPSGWITL